MKIKTFKADQTPDYAKCLSYLTNGTGTLDNTMLNVNKKVVYEKFVFLKMFKFRLFKNTLENMKASVYQASNELQPIKGVPWKENVQGF